MEIIVVVVFILGYLAITMENNLKIDKFIPALLMMAIAWAVVAFGMDSFTTWFNPNHDLLMKITALSQDAKGKLLENTLLHHFGKTAEILIFLMGAMTIVEMIDHFEGFSSIKKLIKTRKKITLLWIVCCLAFFLSAIIDNLTATIVLITILRKIVTDSKDRIWFVGFVIIAANAGGAWTPIGDVTTTMLWMEGKVSAGKLIALLGIPSLINLLVPLSIASFMKAFKGKIDFEEDKSNAHKNANLMLILGLILIIFVPVFKTITHLPPYIGMMLSLALFALLAELLSKRTFTLGEVKDNEKHSEKASPTLKALTKIEMPSILFFLGILMTVAALESLGLIFNFGKTVSHAIPENVFVTLLGLSSAIIDNVPLVAASLGMFQDAPDANVWHFIAYAAGTGGSILIIGSAAGVVAMGMEKISFAWFLKNVTFLALLGYLAGIGAFLGISSFM